MQTEIISLAKFEEIVDDTLNSLTDRIETYIDTYMDPVHQQMCDVSLSDGVLTINLGDEIGTYVINKQTPNRQIWLSSPKSGPKRYDYDPVKKQWIYKHDGVSMHQLLTEEFSKILEYGKDCDFTTCAYGGNYGEREYKRPSLWDD